MTATTIDEVLGTVAKSGLRGGAANALLDLREAALARKDAGDCLGCYFKILSACERSAAALSPLRQWLEERLELVAHAPGAGELERLPIILEGEDLEDFCAGVMDRFREDRRYRHGVIELSLNFRDPACAA
jgi:hypothetical protein